VVERGQWKKGLKILEYHLKSQSGRVGYYAALPNSDGGKGSFQVFTGCGSSPKVQFERTECTLQRLACEITDWPGCKTA
jgi:hypothetical protein